MRILNIKCISIHCKSINYLFHKKTQLKSQLKELQNTWCCCADLPITDLRRNTLNARKSCCETLTTSMLCLFVVCPPPVGYSAWPTICLFAVNIFAFVPNLFCFANIYQRLFGVNQKQWNARCRAVQVVCFNVIWRTGKINGLDKSERTKQICIFCLVGG